MSQGLKHLRRKFPGFERSLGNCVADMGRIEYEKHGFKPRLVDGWIEVRPFDPNDPLDNHTQSRWVAYLNAKCIGGETFRIPVIPDEHNPRPTKIVRPDDQPYVFTLMHEAEEAANAELPGFVNYLKSQLETP